MDEKYTAPYNISNSAEHFEQIAMGHIKGVSHVYKFGSNEDVGTTEEIVSYGGYYGLPTSAEPVTVTSTNGVADAYPAGTNARTVMVQGLDENYEEIEEVVNLGSVSTNSFLRVYRAYVEESGNIDPIGGANAGTISIIQQTSGVIMVQIGPTEGQTLTAAFTVPEGKNGYVWQADATTGEGKSALLRIKTRLYNGTHAFRVQGARYAYQNTVSQRFTIPSKLPPRTDVVFTAVSAGSGTPISATFLIELVEEE